MGTARGRRPPPPAREYPLSFAKDPAMFRLWLNQLARRLFPAFRRGRRRPFLLLPSRPRVEPLEIRLVPTTYTVINTTDSGAGSLRQAILDANASVGTDSVIFNIPTSDSGYDGTGSWTITPGSALPTI